MMPESSPPELGDILCAGLYSGGGEPAIEFEGRWYDRNWFRGVGDAIEDMLRQYPRTVPISLVPRNRPTIAAAVAAVLVHRRPARMIYAHQSSEGKARDIKDLRPAAILAQEDDWDDITLAAAKAIGAKALALTMDDTPANCVRILYDSCEFQSDVEVIAQDTGIELLTSGTTGPPKRISISDRMLRAMAGERIVGTETSAAPELIFQPFGNVAGIYTLLPAISSGQPFVLLEKFGVEEWCGAVERNAIEFAGLPPAGINMILKSDVPKAKLSSLKAVYSGAAPLNSDFQDNFQDKYGIPVLLSYGATEFGGPVSVMTLPLYRKWGREKAHSVGQPFCGSEIRIVSAETGEPQSQGDVGLIEVKTPRVGDQWMATNDLGAIDADGFLYLKGRSDDVIIRGGFKVSPLLVAEALEKHPSVAAAAVIGLADERLGQIPVAAVEVLESFPAPSEAEFVEFARRNLYTMQVPARIIVVTKLPRNASFKVDQIALKDLFSDIGDFV